MRISRRQLLAGSAASLAAAGLPVPTRAAPTRAVPLVSRAVEVLVCNQPDRFKVVYPRHVVERIVNHVPSLGWLGHREPDLLRPSEISHEVSNVRIDGSALVCRIDIFDTPSGRVLKSLPSDEVEFRLAGLCSQWKCTAGGHLVVYEFFCAGILALPVGPVTDSHFPFFLNPSVPGCGPGRPDRS